MSPRHILVPAVVQSMPTLNQVGKPKSKRNPTLYEYPSSLTPYFTHDLPNCQHQLRSPTTISLSHPTIASTLPPSPRLHAPPSLLSTNTMESYWAINDYSVGRNHTVSNPSPLHTRRRSPLSHTSVATFTMSWCCSPSVVTFMFSIVPDGSPNRFPDFHR